MFLFTPNRSCPLNFPSTWLAAVQGKYLASFFNNNNATAETTKEKGELLSFVYLISCADNITSSFLSAHVGEQSGPVIRDQNLYLSNISEIITSIGQFTRHRTQVRGGDKKGADDDSNNSPAANDNNADVQLLLKDIRSYILTNTTNTTNSGESGKPAEVIDKTKECLANNDDNINNHQHHPQTQEPNSLTPSTVSAGQSTQSECDRNKEARPFRRRNSCSTVLLDSILCRLVKLLHGCIESESTRYEFYQIFSDAIHCKKINIHSDSYKVSLLFMFCSRSDDQKRLNPNFSADSGFVYCSH